MHKAEVGPHSTVTTSIRASRPAAPGSILGIPDFFTNSMLTRFNDSTLLREWTVQSLIVARTHPVLVSGKLELQKRHKAKQKRGVPTSWGLGKNDQNQLFRWVGMPIFKLSTLRLSQSRCDWWCCEFLLQTLENCRWPHNSFIHWRISGRWQTMTSQVSHDPLKAS